MLRVMSIVGFVLGWISAPVYGQVGADAPPGSWSAGVPAACLAGGADGFGVTADGGELEPLAIVRRCQFDGPSRPSARAATVTFFDPTKRALYLFGGVNEKQNYTADLWQFQTRPHFRYILQAPSTVPSTGPDPSIIAARAFATGVFDPVARRLIVFGGIDFDQFTLSDVSKDISFNDVWSYPVDEAPKKWTQLFPYSPPLSRESSVSVYDPVGHRMIVYGGRNYFGLPVGNETLALQLDVGNESWSILSTPAKPPGTQERVRHGLVLDRERYRLVLIGGGQAYGGNKAFGDVWALSLDHPEKGWTELTQTNAGPGPFWVGTNSFYEPKTGKIYVVQGLIFTKATDFASSFPSIPPAAYIDQLWSLTPVGDSAVMWSKVRTTFPGGIPLKTDVHWSWYDHHGYSLTGVDNTKAGYYNTEVRIYSLLGAGGAP